MERDSLEKEVENIKKAGIEILREFRAIRQIRQKRNDINYLESKALNEYEEELALKYQRNLNIAKEFEEEFNVPNLVNEVEHLTLEPLNDTKELTKEEIELLQKAINKMQMDNSFENDIKKTRDLNNANFLNEIGITARKEK